jgi:hypothetical protein
VITAEFDGIVVLLREIDGATRAAPSALLTATLNCRRVGLLVAMILLDSRLNDYKAREIFREKKLPSTLQKIQAVQAVINAQHAPSRALDGKSNPFFQINPCLPASAR